MNFTRLTISCLNGFNVDAEGIWRKASVEDEMRELDIVGISWIEYIVEHALIDYPDCPENIVEMLENPVIRTIDLRFSNGDELRIAKS